MNKTKERKVARQKFKSDLFELVSLVGSSSKITSLKIYPGETINVILYQSNVRSGLQLPDIAVGEFPIKEALRYMRGEIRSDNYTVS